MQIFGGKQSALWTMWKWRKERSPKGGGKMRDPRNEDVFLVDLVEETLEFVEALLYHFRFDCQIYLFNA